MLAKSEHFPFLLLFFALLVNIALWLYARPVKTAWQGVPPVPNEAQAAGLSLQDRQLSYRMIGMMLQNLGDTGGHSTIPENYNYETLKHWFFLEDSLDSRSNYIPYLAAFYYGSSREPDQLGHVVDYLYMLGTRPGAGNWRWLAHAVALARFQMDDQERALSLARVMAAMNNPGMPGWTKQMPAFILSAKGERQEAIAVMTEILKTDIDNMHPNEVNFMRDYICRRLMNRQEARLSPLCQNIP